jgi:hypothetical protein
MSTYLPFPLDPPGAYLRFFRGGPSLRSRSEFRELLGGALDRGLGVHDVTVLFLVVIVGIGAILGPRKQKQSDLDFYRGLLGPRSRVEDGWKVSKFNEYDGQAGND